jgi:cytochrome c peroxidase
MTTRTTTRHPEPQAGGMTESAVRRRARKHGLTIHKSRTRTPEHPLYGRYGLFNVDRNSWVRGGETSADLTADATAEYEHSAYTWTLSDIVAHLDSLDEAAKRPAPDDEDDDLDDEDELADEDDDEEDEER